MQLRGIPVIYYYLLSQVFPVIITTKSYHYGISGSSSNNSPEVSKRHGNHESTSISLNPLEDSLKVQEILKKLEEPGEMELRRKPKSRRLHGVISSAQEPLTSKKKKRKRPLIPRSEKSPAVSEFEMELARQIEEDQLKFVEDEKNPMKYVVENGLLFKQSRFSPLARVEIPEIGPKKRKRRPKVKKTKSTSAPIFRTNVFRGNINRQIPAIPLPSPYSAAYGKSSFAINREEDGNCYINRFGYRCCDQALESIIIKSYEKLRRRTGGLELEHELSKIASTLRRETRQVFAKNFEAIVSTSNFGSSIPSEFSCKVELGAQKFIAEVFVPDLGLDTTDRRQRIPYHELSREDLSDSADLVVSRNGILVAQVL
ncbi:unnamed protein product [Caenorhabditis sp. 36 PRJEB53466]|nr:unnamed protein product [Caenorhabditis sp. 36 PRJEB53466]